MCRGRHRGCSAKTLSSFFSDMLPIKRTVKNCKQNRGHIYMGRKRIEARIKKEAVEAVKSGKLTQSEASPQGLSECHS